MFGSSAMKPAEEGAPLHYYNKKYSPQKIFSSNLIIWNCTAISLPTSLCLARLCHSVKQKATEGGKDNKITYYIQWVVKDISHDTDSNHLVKTIARNSTLFDELVEARKAYNNLPNNAKKKNNNKSNVDGIESLKSQPQTQPQKKFSTVMLKLHQTSSRLWQN